MKKFTIEGFKKKEVLKFIRNYLKAGLLIL